MDIQVFASWVYATFLFAAILIFCGFIGCCFYNASEQEEKREKRRKYKDKCKRYKAKQAEKRLKDKQKSQRIAYEKTPLTYEEFLEIFSDIISESDYLKLFHIINENYKPRVKAVEEYNKITLGELK